MRRQLPFRSPVRSHDSLKKGQVGQMALRQALAERNGSWGAKVKPGLATLAATAIDPASAMECERVSHLFRREPHAS
jgi:hypothetical protein